MDPQNSSNLPQKLLSNLIAEKSSNVIKELGITDDLSPPHHHSLTNIGQDGPIKLCETNATNIILAKILCQKKDFGETLAYWPKTRTVKKDQTSAEKRNIGNECLKNEQFQVMRKRVLSCIKKHIGSEIV